VKHRLFGDKYFNKLLILSLPISFYCLYHTYSKGAFVWLAFGILMLFIPHRLDRYRLVLSVTSLFSVIISILIFSVIKFQQDPTSFGTILTRIWLWQAAVSVIFNDYFVLFWGNGFAPMLELSKVFSNIDYPNAHNILLNQVIFFGFPSLFLFMWVFFTALVKLSKHIRYSSGLVNYLGIFIFSVLLSLFGEYFFEPANEGVVLQAQYFFFIALALKITSVDFDKDNLGQYDKKSTV
jgi:hypothetical protein